MSRQGASNDAAAANGDGNGVGVYPAPSGPGEEYVEFDGPGGYVGSIPKGTSMDAGSSTIRTGIDAPLAIRRMSRDIYQRNDSAPREDMANELTSAAVAASRHGASPSIRVVCNRETREFSVHGIDTMGCTWEAFTKSLAVIGRTTNRDSRLAGQMGMGFYSNIRLSDTIIFDSHSRESGERFTAMCKGGTDWQVGLKSAPMPKYGARVSMVVRRRVDMGDIEKMVRKCARLSPFPVYLTTNGMVWEDLPRFSSAKSLARASVYRGTMGSTRSDEHGADLMARLPPTQGRLAAAMYRYGIKDAMYLHGEKDGIEVCCAFTTAVKSTVDGGKVKKTIAIDRIFNRWDAYLVGMPIDLGSRPHSNWDDEDDEDNSGSGRKRRLFDHASATAVVIHDERKYRPTADRERLDADSERRVHEKIDEILREKMSSVKWPSTLAEHLRGPYRAALDAAVGSGRTMGTGDSGMAVPRIGSVHKEIAASANKRVRNGMSRRLIPLCHAVSEHPRSVMAKSADSRRIMAVARHDPSMHVIVTGKPDELAGSGIESIDDYMGRVGIGPLSRRDLADYARSPEWKAVRQSYGWTEDNEERLYSMDSQIVYMVRGRQLRGADVVRHRGPLPAGQASEIVAARSHLGAIVGAMRVSNTACSVAKLAAGHGDGSDGGQAPVLTTDPPAAPDIPPDVRIVLEEDFLRNAAEATYQTSRGEMTGSELAGHNGRMAILQYVDGPWAARMAAGIAGSAWFGKPDTLYVVCDGSEHFSLVSLLGSLAGKRPGGRKPAASREPGAAAAESPSKQQIHRVIALSKIPSEERCKSMAPAGKPTTICDEIGGGDRRGLKCGKWRADLVCEPECEWMQRMDLLLAALELENDAVLAALAGSLDSIGSTWESVPIRSLLDDMLKADMALGSDGASSCETAPSGYIDDFPMRAVNADYHVGRRVRRWFFRNDKDPVVMRRTTTAEVASYAAGRKYHTNNGPRTAEDIMAAAAAGPAGALRRAADIVVYGRDAAGLAAAIPAGENTVAIVDSYDSAVELACAIADGGFKCDIGGEYGHNVPSIMDRVVPRDIAYKFDHGRGAYLDSWAEYPAYWHGILGIRNEALRLLFASTLSECRSDRHGQDVDMFGAIADRFLMIDGQGRRPENDEIVGSSSSCGGGGKGSEGRDDCGTTQTAMPAAKQAAGRNASGGSGSGSRSMRRRTAPECTSGADKKR